MKIKKIKYNQILLKKKKKIKHPGKENVKLDKIPDEKPENKWL